MMRSMYASVSGLSSHQDMFDVIGNNISNVNTIGYKGSRTTFKEMLTQTIQGATAPQSGRGGTNPVQMGLGVETGSVDTDMSPGSLQATGNKSDAAIQGEGFFVVNDGTQNVYTRAGNMTFDRDGYLTNSSSGFRVQGWIAEEDGTLDNLSPDQIGDIRLDQSMDPKATENIDYTGNLSKSEYELSTGSDTLTVDDGTDSDNISVFLTETDFNNVWQFDLEAEQSALSEETGYIILDDSGETIDSIYTGIDEDGNGTGTDLTGGSIDVDLNQDGTETGSIDLAANGDALSDSPLFTGVIDGGDNDQQFASYADKTITTDVYDSQGGKHTVKLKIARTGYNQWVIRDNEDSLNVSGAEPDGNWFGGNPHEINFDTEGKVANQPNTVNLTFEVDGELGMQTVELDFSDFTQFGGNMTADFDTVDGYPSGEFTTFSVGTDGTITGSFDNGQNKPLAKIALASFSNPAGLIREEGAFRESTNSGQAKIGEAGIGGRGELAPANLEMSNVDMAEQFTKMITAQRGYQASSRIITTSDEMIQEVVNMKR